MAGSRSTAARVTRGAISLSSSSHFPPDAVFEIGKTGGVAARPSQAVDEAGTDRVRSQREHDRYGTGCLQQRAHGPAANGQDGVRRERHQFRRVTANALGIARAPSNVDPQVAAVGPA
jgi:hypothetical protein